MKKNATSGWTQGLSLTALAIFAGWLFLPFGQKTNASDVLPRLLKTIVEPRHVQTWALIAMPILISAAAYAIGKRAGTTVEPREVQQTTSAPTTVPLSQTQLSIVRFLADSGNSGAATEIIAQAINADKLVVQNALNKLVTSRYLIDHLSSLYPVWYELSEKGIAFAVEEMDDQR